ncbi:MAG TPA: hypothetical protein VKR43_07205 [Bryobacteraceae bacterium]|nr:hypothetical protein [Bryobacteraceae bacterium]
MLKALAVTAVFCALTPAQTVLNMSHDLTTRNIASSNLVPDSPGLDAGPLLTQAISYAQKNGITSLIADRGNYYFLSLANNQTHVQMTGVSNLTVDFQYSDLYFQKSNRGAIWCSACNAVVLQNFTVDYMTLPFTQLSVTAVNASQRTLTVQPMAGYQTPDAFNTPRTPDQSDDLEAFVFRNGVPIPDVGRLPMNLPATPTGVSIGGAGNPWARQANLALIQPGDVLVYTDRGGPHTIHFVSSENSTVHNVSIYSAGAMALSIPSSSGMLIDHVQLIPRPGTDRLISGNADGIHATYAGANNKFSNNIVRRNCDDAFAFDAPWAAAVSSASSGTTVAVSRFAGSTFPEGSQIAFINAATEAVSGTAHIVKESPPSSQQTGANGESVTLTLDQAVAGLNAGDGVVTTDPTMHGGGSSMQFNLAQENVFSRGLWLSGVTGISVHDNFFQRTSKPGIFIQQYNTAANSVGPSSNITIQNNVVDSAISYGNPSIGPIVAAASIHSVAEDVNAAQVASSAHVNISVTGNRVTNSPRTAIRLENVTGGLITGNIIQAYGLAPTTNVFLIPSCCETSAQYQADFKQAVLTTNTLSVTSLPNMVSSAAPLAIGSTASYTIPKIAPGSLAFAYGAGLASSSAVSVIDSAGTSRPASIIFASDVIVSFQVPDGTAPGIATVSIGAQSGGVLIEAVAPGIFSANSSGAGVAAATAALYHQDGTNDPVTVFQPASSGAQIATPMSLGSATDFLQVTLYGTGLRAVSSLSNVAASIGGQRAQVLYAGAQPTYPGLDQVNIIVPKTLAGAGEVPVIVTFDGQTANVVTISLQ